MVNYVNTVLVSNLSASAIASYDNVIANTGAMNTPSVHAGKFVILNCDPDVVYNATNHKDMYITSAADIANAYTIKVGVITKKNCAIRKPDGTTEYRAIIKWSNEIKAADIKSYSALATSDWSGKTTEDTVVITFTGATDLIGSNKLLSTAGKRIIVRLTYKDMPHRYRKWTESYEYVTKDGDTAATIATGIANIINHDWKRARVQASAANGVLTITALPYDDDDSVDSLNWANKVRFNANMYYTDPAGDGWESLNKHFITGATIVKTPGEQYPASAKLVRDRESWAMGYQGILNRGEGTWPIIKPDMETQLGSDYDAITLEFENMYRAADDIQRKTKQTLEIYCHDASAIKGILDAFVSGEKEGKDVNPSA